MPRGTVVKTPALNAGSSGSVPGQIILDRKKIGTLLAPLLDAWCCGVGDTSVRPGVAVLWLGEIASLTSNICF